MADGYATGTQGGSTSSAWDSASQWGSLAQGATNLGTTIATIINMGKESAASAQARKRWESMQQPAAQLLSSLYYSPAAQGQKTSYGDAYYNYAPSKAMQAMYSNYLNRQYGMSESVARAMVGQSMAPLKIGRLTGPASSAAAYSGSKINAQALSNAAMGAQAPQTIRTQDYLQNAAKLSAFNTWRAQQLGQIIG